MTSIDSEIQSNDSEAQRLYQRGRAAARGGHKRVAAGLLTRSVQLDPRNEQAWLWLSGALEDPHQIAFCLNTVLKLNPSSERAQKGLRWLESRDLLAGTPQPAPVLNVQLDAADTQRQSDRQGESWWVQWRQSRRTMNRTRLLLWSVPLMLLCAALVLYQNFAFAVERSQVTPTPVAQVTSAEVAVEPTVAPILEAEPASVRESATIGYLSALEPLRQRLREATDSYREATNQTTGASLERVAATQTLRTAVEQGIGEMDQLRPPVVLQQYHDDYRTGLDLEVQGLDAVLEFYGSYKVEYANQAALHFQEASVYIDRARAAFDAHSTELGQVSAMSAHTVR